MATNATEVPEQIHPVPINSPPTSPPIAPTTAPIEVPVSSIGVGDIEDETVNQIEADDLEAHETDSAIGDDRASIASSKTSLISGVAKYRIENGRRYHAYRDGKYLLPNDEAEQDRLDLHNHVFNLVFEGKLFQAPIESPSRVLDVGTGTGIWAIDFADQFPSAHVIGCDLSPIQPGWIPPNLEFEVDDIEDTWTHKPFAYIHIRSLAGSIRSWSRLFSQAYDNLTPGGYLEVTEFEVWVHDQRDDYYNWDMLTRPPQQPGMQMDVMGQWRERKERDAEMHMIRKWQEGLSEAAGRIGRSFDVAVHLRDWMIGAGFLEVVERLTRVPAAPWARNRRQKEIGLYQQQNMLDASSAYGQAHFTRVLGWSPQEYEILSAGVRNELKDLRLQLYSNLFVVYGRKPGGTGKDREV